MAKCTTIGLTGDAGSGKSTVRRWLAERGAATLDGDQVVHELLARDAAVIAAVAGRFGNRVVYAAGGIGDNPVGSAGGIGDRGVAVAGDVGDRETAARGIDRRALAGLVFADPVALADLEAILHPAVIAHTRRWMAECRAAGLPAAVVEAVKLVESGMQPEFDEMWLVACDRDVRRQRLAERGWSPPEVERRMAAAGPLEPKLALASHIVDNSGTWPATERQLATAWSAHSQPHVSPAPDAGAQGESL